MEGHCRRRAGLRSPRKSARQLRGRDFHKLRSMGHWYKESSKRKRNVLLPLLTTALSSWFVDVAVLLIIFWTIYRDLLIEEYKKIRRNEDFYFYNDH